MSAVQLQQELATSLRTSKVQLDAANQQLAHIQRQSKIAEVTVTELESYPNDKVWRSCGKTFIMQDKTKYIDDLKHDEGVLREQEKALKIKQNYLETTVEKSLDNLKALLNKQ